MKKREFTDEEWALILKLKQSGASWLKIQDDTGVPRRTIKRAYEEWESTKSTDELKQARIHVAVEDFRAHTDDLITLAESMIEALYIPLPMEEIPKASELLNDLWKTDIPNIYGGVIPEIEVPRVIRRNQRLFRSLKEHTQGKVRWEVLEEWQRALERYRIDSRELRREAHNSVQGVLTEQPELVDKIKAKYTKKEIVEKMGMGITEALWRSILAGEVDKCDEYINTLALGGGRWQVYFGKEASRTVIDLDNAGLAEEVAEVCRTAMKTIIQGEKSTVVEEMAVDIKVMEKKKQSLEDMLDRIVLRPIILRTRCELCPA